MILRIIPSDEAVGKSTMLHLIWCADLGMVHHSSCSLFRWSAPYARVLWSPLYSNLNQTLFHSKLVSYITLHSTVVSSHFLVNSSAMSSFQTSSPRVVCSYECNGLYSRTTTICPMSFRQDYFCLRDRHEWPLGWKRENLPFEIVVPVCAWFVSSVFISDCRIRTFLPKLRHGFPQFLLCITSYAIILLRVMKSWLRRYATMFFGHISLIVESLIGYAFLKLLYAM